MKSLQVLIFSLLLAAAPTAIFAHGPGGHGHHGSTISAEKAKVVASQKCVELVKAGKLGPDWTKIKPEEPTQKSFGHGPEWVVKFKNPKEKDSKKTELFIFVNMQGKAIGSNFTGK